MEPLLKIMGQCVTDLKRVWNVSDPTGEQSSHSTRATANIYRFFKMRITLKVLFGKSSLARLGSQS
jgi:hypothetical protein